MESTAAGFRYTVYQKQRSSGVKAEKMILNFEPQFSALSTHTNPLHSSATWRTRLAVIDDYSDRFGASAYFTPDLRKLFALTEPDEYGMYRNPEITTEQYIVFSKSDTVKNALFQGSRQTYSDQLTGLDQGS